MAENLNFRLPCSHRFFAINGSCSYGAKSRWGLLRVYLGANGVPFGQKNGTKRWKLPCPKSRNFDDPAVIDFSQKMEVTVMAPNHGGDPLGSILGPMGSHWVQRKGQNCKKWQCRKIRTFDYPAVIHFPKNGSKWLCGPPRAHLGANGVPLGKKNGSKPQKIAMPPNSNFRLPRGHGFFAKNGSYGYGAKSRWGPPRVHLRVNGAQFG